MQKFKLHLSAALATILLLCVFFVKVAILKKYSDIVIRVEQSSFLNDTYDARVAVHVRGIDGFSICCEYVSEITDVSRNQADSFIVVKKKEAETIKRKIDSVLSLK